MKSANGLIMWELTWFSPTSLMKHLRRLRRPKRVQGSSPLHLIGRSIVFWPGILLLPVGQCGGIVIYHADPGRRTPGPRPCWTLGADQSARCPGGWQIGWKGFWQGGWCDHRALQGWLTKELGTLEQTAFLPGAARENHGTCDQPRPGNHRAPLRGNQRLLKDAGMLDHGTPSSLDVVSCSQILTPYTFCQACCGNTPTRELATPKQMNWLLLSTIREKHMPSCSCQGPCCCTGNSTLTWRALPGN